MSGEQKICKKTTIGGQALIEGVFMRGPEKIAIAVRKPNRDVVVRTEVYKGLSKNRKILQLPVIRGVVMLVESMKIGLSALMYSASFYEDEKTEKKDGFLKRIFHDKADDVANVLTILFSFIMALVLFFFIPTWITSLFRNFIQQPIWLNLIEGFIRILIFISYVLIVSRVEEVNRVFQYHGAEHKSIHCYEQGDDLTIENIKSCSILHPRCGTSFLLMVMIVSIVILSFFGWPNPWLRMLTRLIAVPLIVGISYEMIKLIGRSSSILAKILIYPGLWLQKVATVREPDDEQIEVAIAALKEVIPENQEADIW